MTAIWINFKLKVSQIWNRYQLTIQISFLTLIISIIGIIIFKFVFSGNDNLKNYANSIYSIQYDSNWELIDSTDNNASLKYNDSANIKFEITTLTNDYLYMSLENIVEEITYTIQQANPNYYLIGKQDILVTNKKYEGYQLLYENGENGVLLTLFKREDKIVSIVYEASYDYFDILLDSVKNIIHNFDLLDKEYQDSYNLLEIESKDLSLNGNEEIEISDTKTYEIADNHYIVEFEVPSQFKRRVFNSRYSVLNYDGLSNGNIDLTASVYNYNLYEVLEKLKDYSFDYSIKSAHNEDNITKETYTKVSDSKYIYHVMYNAYTSKYDVVYLIYELDYKHAFIVQLIGVNSSLDESIINNINMVEKTKYAEYIYRNIDNGNIVNEMKYAYTDYTDYARKYSQVTLYTPQKYVEYDNGVSNVYEERTFKKNYNEDTLDYDFKVTYSVTSLNIENSLKILENTYYKNSKRVNVGNKNYNDKEFKVYSYNYKNKGITNYVYVLFYGLESGNNLEIVVESKNDKIKDSEIIELTNFTEKIYTMN